MKPFFKFIVIVSIIPLFIGLYFFDNIKGYYRFKQYCEKEGGLRIATPLEKNVGWLADDYWDARTASLLDYVGFVRYTDKEDGNLYDLRYLGDEPQRDSSYERSPADQSKTIQYKWLHINQRVLDELRLSRSGYEVRDINTGGILVRYYYFGYSRFDRSRTILDAPSGVGCLNNVDSDGMPKSLVRINEAFKI